MRAPALLVLFGGLAVACRPPSPPEASVADAAAPVDSGSTVDNSRAKPTLDPTAKLPIFDGGPVAAAPKPPAPAADAGAPPAPSKPEAVIAPELGADEALRLEQELRGLTQYGAREDALPWAIAHGLIAFGPEFRTRKDIPAVEAIASNARPDVIGEERIWGFPPQTTAGQPVEPHSDLMALVLTEVGLDPETPLPVSETATITLAELVEDAEHAFALPSPSASWDDFAWSANLFFLTHGLEDELSTRDGALSMRELAETALSRVELEQAFLDDLMKVGAPERVQKRRQGIFAFTCGGLHLVQAGLRGAAMLGTPEAIERARHQLEILRFRWVAERRIYREALAANPDYAPLLLVQELKFFGHALETLALAVELNILEPDAATRGLFKQIAGDLRRTVSALTPIYSAGDAIRRVRAQTYYDLIGDGCHAIHALSRGRPLMYAATSTTSD